MKDDLKSPIIIKYQNLYKEDPTSRVFAPLAEAYRKFGMVDEAIEILKKGIKHHPDFILGYLGIAFCYFDNEEFNMAYETLRPLIESNRENIRLQKLFADTCFELGKQKEALDAYKYLLYINPRDTEAAERVQSLESDFSSEDIILNEIAPENNETSSKFSVNEIDDTYDDKADEWVRVDMEKQDSISEMDDDSASSWEMQKLEETSTSLKSANPVSNIEEDTPNSTIEYSQESASSPVSHTLVNLYLEQGSRNKAIEVLEKIIELNPTDQHSAARLDELRKENEYPKAESVDEYLSNDNALQRKIETLIRFKEAILARSSEKRVL